MRHLIVTGAGWGGNPRRAAVNGNGTPVQIDGNIPHALTVKDVSVDAFWSITVYNADGFIDENELGAYSFNNVTAQPNADGTFTVHFSACGDGRINCLPIKKGWNYAARMYEPSKQILDGDWTFPEPVPLNY